MPRHRFHNTTRSPGLLSLMAMAIGLAIATLTPDATAIDTKDNAALKYWRAFSLISEEQRRALGGAVFSVTEYGLEFADGEQPIEVDDLLNHLDFVVEMLVDGSRLPGCDFSADWHLGIEALLPELALMRMGARLVMLDASRELNSGDPDAAAERVAAAIRIAHHTGQDPVLMSSLVGLSIFRMATEFAMEGERAGVWTEEGRNAIAQALARFPSDDPFGFIRAMRGEERWVGDWMEARLDNEWTTAEAFARDANEYFMLEIAQILPAGPNGQVTVTLQSDADVAADSDGVERFNALLQSDDFRAAMKKEIDLYRLAVRMNTEVWNNPDASQHFIRFERMLCDGEFGIIATVMIPAFARGHRQDMESRRMLDEIRLMFRTK